MAWFGLGVQQLCGYVSEVTAVDPKGGYFSSAFALSGALVINHARRIADLTNIDTQNTNIAIS